MMDHPLLIQTKKVSGCEVHSLCGERTFSSTALWVKVCKTLDSEIFLSQVETAAQTQWPGADRGGEEPGKKRGVV